MGKSELSVAITGDAAPLDREMRRASDGLRGFSSNISTTSAMAAGAIAGLASSAVQMGASLITSLGQSAAGIASWGIGLAAEAEQAQIAFGVMLGGADNAKRLLTDLTAFAASTPFEFPELRDAAKSLISFGESQEQVMPVLKGLGDLASGLGVPLNDLAQIYGKARTAGRLQMEDINQLAGRGIPIYAELAKQFSVAESEVRKLVEKGQVGFPNLQKAIVSLTSEGGKFGGMMDQQSASLSGLWSTLSDTIGTAAKEIGDVLIEEFGLKQMLTDGISFSEMIKRDMIPMTRAFAKDLIQFSEWGINGVRSLSASFIDMAIQAEKGFGHLTAGAKAAINVLAMLEDARGNKAAGRLFRRFSDSIKSDDITGALEKTAAELRKPIRQVVQEWREGLASAAGDAAKSQGEMAAIAIESANDKLDQKAKEKKTASKPLDNLAVAGLDLGSREAFSAIAAYRRSGVDKVPEQHLAETKKTNALLQRMVDRPTQSIPVIESLV